MNIASVSRNPRHKRWRYRLINVAGGIGIFWILAWGTGFEPYALLRKAMEPRAIPIAKAPLQPSSMPIGLAPVLPRGNDSSISPEPLALRLVAIKPGRTIYEGSVQLGVISESPQTYQAGAILENGAKLDEIHADYVVLTRGKESARLYLEGASRTQGGGSNAMLMVGGVSAKLVPAKITSREVVTDYIRPSPMYEGDTLAGYQVFSGLRHAAFSQMGLEAGDVITDLDGLPLNDPTLAWDLFRQLASGSVMVATVRRKGTNLRESLDGGVIVRAEETRSELPTKPFDPTSMN